MRSLLLILALAGCAATPEMAWTKPGGSAQEFYADLGQCRAQAFSVPNAPLMQVAIVQHSCLQGKGWQQVPRGQ